MRQNSSLYSSSYSSYSSLDLILIKGDYCDVVASPRGRFFLPGWNFLLLVLLFLLFFRVVVVVLFVVRAVVVYVVVVQKRERKAMCTKVSGKEEDLFV